MSKGIQKKSDWKYLYEMRQRKSILPDTQSHVSQQRRIINNYKSFVVMTKYVNEAKAQYK